jgi:hypothetical protein
LLDSKVSLEVDLERMDVSSLPLKATWLFPAITALKSCERHRYCELLEPVEVGSGQIMEYFEIVGVLPEVAMILTVENLSTLRPQLLACSQQSNGRLLAFLDTASA